mmetsp:Transcript_9931/g.28454  ORF Transcript_9931/g.28454 Transcript_9931/m.28454 type:complete len:405 (-) Transcript_9931:403-1617(-)
MSFAQWMAQMRAEEEAIAEQQVGDEEVEEVLEVGQAAHELEKLAVSAEKGDGHGDGEVVIKVSAMDATEVVEDNLDCTEGDADATADDAILEDEEEDGLVMADELEEHAQHFKQHMMFRQSRVTQEDMASIGSSSRPTQDSLPDLGDVSAGAILRPQELEAGPSGRIETGSSHEEGSLDSQEEDAEVLVRFRVNQHIAVTVHKACSKDDFEEVVALLPQNTPLPSSDRMIYLLARVIEDMETGEVGRAVGCLMASIGTCMISSCIYAFDDPHEVEQYTTEERVELWGLQIPQPSLQLQEMMAATGEVPLKEWSSVDRLTMSIGLLFGLCCYADDNEIRAGFCVPRPQLLDRWMSAGVPMHGLGRQMQLIYPPHAHDYHYYRSSTVAYFLVDEVIETLGFILAFL